MHRNCRVRLGSGIGIGLLVALRLYGQPPTVINYQGRVSVDGIHVDSVGRFKFAVIDNDSGETRWSHDGSSNLGSEPLSSIERNIHKGLFNVLLGDTTIPNMTQAMTADVFGLPNVRLRVWFSDGGGGFQALEPDQRLAAVAYAMVADRVPGDPSIWRTGGNAGTSAGFHFLGTTDDQPLELRVDGQRVLRIEPDASSPFLVAGHPANVANRSGAVIGGGGSSTRPNMATNTYATIGGGLGHTAGGSGATVGGGRENAARGLYAVIAGGWENIAGGSQSSIGGGFRNVASGNNAAVGGGERNTATDTRSTVAGGERNQATAAHASIGGGDLNQAMNRLATVAGGGTNLAGGVAATVAGGVTNRATADYATVSGGRNNLAGQSYAAVGGGRDNTAIGWYATISGGEGNTADALLATVGGGDQNAATGDRSTIGGGRDNNASAMYATIAGGSANAARGAYATVAGGSGNLASNNYAAVGGGRLNQALGEDSTVGGGYNNVTSDDVTTISGGKLNRAAGVLATVGGGQQNSATRTGATVGGGFNNNALGLYAVIPGGRNNHATNDAFAAGHRAKANHAGSFVWADSTNVDFASTTNDQFRVRASGGVQFQTPGNWDLDATEGDLRIGNNTYRLKIGISMAGAGAGDVWLRPQGGTGRMFLWTPGGATFYSNTGKSLGVRLAANGTAWDVVSDREAKQNFVPIDTDTVLEALAAMPVTAWNYKDDPDQRRYIGPVAQAFHAAFGLGNTTSITTLDADGVLFAAVQALHTRNARLQTQNEALTQDVSRISADHARLSAELEAIKRHLGL